MLVAWATEIVQIPGNVTTLCLGAFMGRSGNLIVLVFTVAACLLVGCAPERDARLIGSWAGNRGPNGLTFHADGSGVLFQVVDPPRTEYGTPLQWNTSRGECVTIRLTDEHRDSGRPVSICYSFDGQDLVLADGYEFLLPRRLKRQQ